MFAETVSMSNLQMTSLFKAYFSQLEAGADASNDTLHRGTRDRYAMNELRHLDARPKTKDCIVLVALVRPFRWGRHGTCTSM